MLPVNSNTTYLIRLWFLFGNHNGIQQLPKFNITLEMPNMLYQMTPYLTKTPSQTSEKNFMASSDVLYVCMIRTSESSDPFISGIQLRVLSNGMYEGKIRTGTTLNSLSRYNMGAYLPDFVRSLENNHLSGLLPDVCSLTKLEILRLHNNNISGNIPDCLSQLNNLRELNLENNSFSGVIPKSLLTKAILKFSYSGNAHLCKNKDECEKNNKKKLAIVLGSVISSILVIFLASLIIYYKRIFMKRGHLQPSTNVSVNVPNPIHSRLFSPEDMKIATHNFSQQIGQGGFGIVYFGNFVDGTEVAVKVLSTSSKQGVVEFLNEIDLLSRINHKNLVSLLGYCNDSKQLMLVYEHMSGGSLKDHLYGSMANNKKLDWKARVRVALDAAEGLEYLHVSTTPKIIHRDVKSSNILLDSKMRAKVSDSGLSRIVRDDMASHVTTNVKGTIGYLDPEYFDTNKLTEKSDVYSFGVVLLEIICGRKPIDDKLEEEKLNIVKWVKLHLQSNENSPRQLTDIIDKRLKMSDHDLKSFYHIIDLSMRCIESDGSKRPTISEIVNTLKEAIVMTDFEDSSKQSGESSASAESSCSILHVGR